MKSVLQLKHEREKAEEELQKRKMLEMLLECYADRAEISIKPPTLKFKQYDYSKYIIQVYIPLKSDEINKLMEEI